MSGFKGFADLQSASDLRDKLRHDLMLLRERPDDQYLAFNFFVTAEHIVDWLHPESKEMRSERRKSNSLLEVTSHLANGAKHFKALDKRHTSIDDVRIDRILPKGYVEEGYCEEPLIVHLTDVESARTGCSQLRALELAEKVYEYWESQNI